MTDDSKRQNNIIRGHFPPPDPPAGVRFGVGLRYDVEHRDDGPWLVVYAYGKKIGEVPIKPGTEPRSEEHTSELQSRENLVCRLLLEKKNTKQRESMTH